MHPVGYYDLSLVGFPLHATAFRPLDSASLAVNPFRVFTSVLRLDLLPVDVRELAEEVLSKRNLFTDRLLELLEQAETKGSLTSHEEDEFLANVLETFRWHSMASVPHQVYLDLNQAHPMVSDIASFPSAHINHLTPRTLDIDLVQTAMIKRGMPAKERIEGPPKRSCQILLRQTSFKALEELVRFDNGAGNVIDGHHTARFGEVEQRGAAVTKKGRDLYDRLLKETNETSSATDSSGGSYPEIVRKVFKQYPDTWDELRTKKLVYFRYSSTQKGEAESQPGTTPKLSELIDNGYVRYEPITYEDFLPISAAGIFTSNIKGSLNNTFYEARGDLGLLERSLGRTLYDPTELYDQIEADSLKQARQVLNLEEIIVD
jgi:uncharacterized glyoxalase superfamily metalloenzyme YdcJ